MAAQPPATWDERVPVYDNGDPISGREATIIDEDALNGFRALLLGLAQTAGLPTNATHAQIMEAFKQRVVITGEVKAFAGAAAPTGWLLCDGALVSRTTYADLFAAIGVAYGAADDSTTFALPDLRGRVPIGAGHDVNAGLSNRALGEEGGDEAMQAHSHRILGSTSSSSIANDLQEGNRIGADSYSGGQSAYRNIGRGGNTYIETTGEGHAENMPPYLGVNYIIKT